MGRKILKSCLLTLLALLLLALVVINWYLPRYLHRREALTMSPKSDSITMMSCNVRCLTPMDLGKKSWFYRAELLMDDIASQTPGIIGFQEVTTWQYDYLVETNCKFL